MTATDSSRWLSTGVDIVSIDRIERLVDKFGDSFVERAYTLQEAQFCRSRADPAQHFAARWAAKEATLKALPETDATISPGAITVLSNGEAPRLEFTGPATETLDRFRNVETSVSLSHDQSLGAAIAQVLLRAETSHTGGT